MHRTLPDSVLTYWDAWAAGIPAIPNAATTATRRIIRFMAQRVMSYEQRPQQIATGSGQSISAIPNAADSPRVRTEMMTRNQIRCWPKDDVLGCRFLRRLYVGSLLSASSEN
jgi:hypothetical protein